MKIIQAICTKNECFISNKGRKRTPTGIVVHSTGANNTKLSRYCDNEEELGKNPNKNHWNQLRPDGRQVCVHGFIGHDKNESVEFCQTLPFDIPNLWNSVRHFRLTFHAGDAGKEQKAAII